MAYDLAHELKVGAASPLLTLRDYKTEARIAFQITLLKWTKDKPFWECPDEIDVSLLSDALAALYRFLPEEESLTIFHQCLEPERSDAVKLCVVKACLTLVVDVRVSSFAVPVTTELNVTFRRDGSFHGSGQ